MLDEKILRQKIKAALEPKRQALQELEVQRKKLIEEAKEEGGAAELEAFDPRLDLHAHGRGVRHVCRQPLEPRITDTARLCWDTLDAGRTVLFEGARGSCSTSTTAPIRSSPPPNPVAGAACVEDGVGLADIDEVSG